MVVSIIIPSHNGKHLLAMCLPTVMNLRRVLYEVIVVDNGSTDGTEEFLAEHYPSVKVVVTPEKLGFSKAVNLGISRATGDAIALLNNDTEVEPDWLRELVDVLRHRPEVGVCASRILKAEERHLLYSAGDGFTIAGFGYQRGSEEPEAIRFLKPEYVFAACAGAALYRREVFERIGTFDEDFYAFYEDLDLAFRAQMAGFRCMYVPAARVYHIGGATFGNRATRPLYYGYRNRLSLLAKNLPTKLLFWHLPSIIAFSVVSILMYTAKGHGWTLLRAHFDGLRSLPMFIAKRSEVQAHWVEDPVYLEHVLDKNWPGIMLRLSRFMKRFYQPVQSVRRTIDRLPKRTVTESHPPAAATRLSSSSASKLP